MGLEMSEALLERIEAIEKELQDIKSKLISTKKKEKTIRLKGILEGIEISDKEIEDAKKIWEKTGLDNE
jgi:acetylornithine/succinyldiaminopimelate/putrescine aminotransferase